MTTNPLCRCKLFPKEKKYRSLKFNNTQIPQHQSIKYFGITLDKRLTWSNHIKQKHKQLNPRLHLLQPLLKSNKNIKNK